MCKGAKKTVNTTTSASEKHKEPKLVEDSGVPIGSKSSNTTCLRLDTGVAFNFRLPS